VTGFSPAIRALVLARAQGCCEVCGCDMAGLQVHHRRPRGMGGSLRPDTNRTSNALVVCTSCHAAIESHREYARQRGYLVRQFGRPPLETPVLLHGAEWCLLDDDGGVV